jgi:hypothetical protein
MLGMHCPGRATHYAPDEANAAGCCNTTACSLQCRTGSLESYDQQFVCQTLHTQAPHSVQVLAQTPDTELYSWCPALCRHMHHDRPSQHHACQWTQHTDVECIADTTASCCCRLAGSQGTEPAMHAPCTQLLYGTTLWNNHTNDDCAVQHALEHPVHPVLVDNLVWPHMSASSLHSCRQACCNI